MSEIDWTEFFEVLAGRGPMNAVRLQNRRSAHEDGAWVREAAAEYARKRAGIRSLSERSETKRSEPAEMAR
jgi:ring-1,2-phenylacetyl-CoA epoxidase subunit PaaA